MNSIKWILFLCVFLGGFTVKSQVKIKGQTVLDTTWNREIYASKIPTLNAFYKCSNSLLIASSKIDSLGLWELDIPEGLNTEIIRIHVSKKAYPVASLIIGGEDNNHAFIAIGKSGVLNYIHSGDRLFSDFACKTDPLNGQMKKIKGLFEAREFDYQTAKDPHIKTEIRSALAKELRIIADTISDVLPAIYAAHLSDMGFNKDEVYDTMAAIDAKFGSHPYLEEYALDTRSNRTATVVIVICGLLFISYLSFRALLSYQTRHKKKLRDSLSGREVEVFNLVIEAKSNKEIADILHVEISTVKSHLHNIYTKLKVSSRNQLKRFS